MIKKLAILKWMEIVKTIVESKSISIADAYKKSSTDYNYTFLCVKKLLELKVLKRERSGRKMMISALNQDFCNACKKVVEEAQKLK